LHITQGDDLPSFLHIYFFLELADNGSLDVAVSKSHLKNKVMKKCMSMSLD